MSAFTGGMDDTCPACKRVVGDHTMREFEACTVSRSHVIDYGPVSKALNERFGIDPDVIVVDHMLAKAVVLAGAAGPLEVTLAGLLLEFGTSETGQVETVAKILFLADPAGQRAAGKLLRDTANGAANAAERA